MRHRVDGKENVWEEWIGRLHEVAERNPKGVQYKFTGAERCESEVNG